MPPGRNPGGTTLPAKLALTFALLAFIGLACLWVDRPGLQYDEALFVTASYPNPPRGGAGYFEVFGEPVCVMVLPYLGALKGWLYRLIFVLVQPSAAAVRVPVVLFGALTLLLLFRFSRRVFDTPTGLVAVALTASDPVFLFTTRLDWGPVAIQRLCWLGGCVLLLRWREHPTAARLLAASVVFGIGLFDKLTFVWVLAALLVAAVAVVPRELAAGIRGKTAAIAAAGVALGSLPLLVYRLGSPARALGLRWESGLTPYLAKLSMLHHSLDGTIFQGWLAHVTAPRPALPEDVLGRWVCLWTGQTLLDPTWFPWALGAALAFLPWTLRTPRRRALLFVLLFCIIAIALMLPVLSGGSPHHLTLIYPFPQLFVAASLTTLAARIAPSRKPRFAPAVLFGVVCVLCFANLRAVTRQYGQILQFGGTPPWSEAIYALHDALESSNPRRVVVLDWGIAMQLRLLSRDRLPLTEAPQPGTEEQYFLESVRQGLAGPDTVFVGRVPSVAGFNLRTRELLGQAAAGAGLRLRRGQLIRDLQNRPLLEIIETE